jgi:hypothetical protein
MPVRDLNRFVIHHIGLLGCISNELLSQKHAKISETHCQNVGENTVTQI